MILNLDSKDRLAKRLFDDLSKVIVKHMDNIERKKIDVNVNTVVSSAALNLTLSVARMIGDKDLGFTLESLRRMKKDFEDANG